MFWPVLVAEDLAVGGEGNEKAPSASDVAKPKLPTWDISLKKSRGPIQAVTIKGLHCAPVHPK
jgi:hypothetical protein